MIKRGPKISGQVEKIGLIMLIVSLAVSIVGSVWAIHFESIINNPSQVGFINAFLEVIAIIGFIFFIPVIEKNKKTKILFLTLIVYAVSYFLFSIFKTILSIIILGILISLASSVRINTLGIIMRDKSQNKSVSKNEGFVYTLLNISWLIGPIISALILQKFGIESVFILSSTLILIAMIMIKKLKINDSHIIKNTDKNALKIAKEFFKKKKFIINYILSGGISFYWAFIYIFIPIYIIESGASKLVVGYFLSAITIPLILFEYKFGKIAGKKGFKKFFFLGYFIIAIVTIFSFFINNLYIILFALILGSVGISMLEPTTEAYFFDITSKKERQKFYGIYNTAISINNAISMLLISILLKFLEFKYSFLLIGFFMLVFAFVSLKTKNILEIKRKNR